MYSPLELGSIFARRYRVDRRIPGGGMGAVYEVAHVATERRCALKVMLPELVQDAGLRERFQHEARVTAKVESEYIVDVLDAGLDEATGMLFLVMELLKGEELGKRLARTGAFAPAEVMTYLGQVANALDKTHAAASVHRDLKPENLFVTFRDDASPRIKILDFGISKVLKEGMTTGNRTASLGTPLYMAPEQFSGYKPSPATDIYALGLIAYTLLVGAVYWQEESERVESAIAFALQAINGPVESPVARAARYGCTLPPAFDAWFATATHRDPALRFQRASDAVSALGQALGLAQPVAASFPVAAAGGSAAGQPTFASSMVRATSVPATVMPSNALKAVRPPGRSVGLLVAGVGATVTLAAIVAVVVMVTDRPRTDPAVLGSAGSSEPRLENTGTPKASETSAAATLPTSAPAPSALPASSNSVAPPPSLPPKIVLPPPSPPPAKFFCYEHPDSGRIKLYAPGAPAKPGEMFACYRDAAGALKRR